jgi:xanthine dehydrogenase accessory factor
VNAIASIVQVPATVCVEVRAVRGSAPREAGARMLVGPEGEQGSIGGGQLEFIAIQHARGLLAGWRDQPELAAETTRPYNLGPGLGQCCGGAVTLAYLPWFETVLPRPASLFHLQLHGAGHVGRALARLLRTLPCTVDWVDARAGVFPPDPRQAGDATIRHHHAASPDAVVAKAPPGSFFLVMTHSHALDAVICEAVLQRDDAAYIGLIGSRTKRARFSHRWRAHGLSDEAIARLVCPIGIPGIGGKQPEVLAMAVAAQLLQHATVKTPPREATAAPAASCLDCAAAC